MRHLIQNIGKLYTLEGLDSAGGRAFRKIRPCDDAVLLLEGGLVVFAGRRVDATFPLGGPISASGPRRHRHSNPYPPAPEVIHSKAGVTVVDAHGALVTPGLVDPHTHVVYAGDRSGEMALRLAGVSYLDILARGGGILSTVRETRTASDEDLYAAASVRLEAMLHLGTTTAEVKTGYGLSLEEELRHLRIIRDLAQDVPMRLAPTFLGAHAVPPEYQRDSNEYVGAVVDRMIPAVANQGVARFCDVFCEPGVFSAAQSRRILTTAREYGLGRKIHADEIAAPSRGESGAAVAADVAATSADHLRATDTEGMRILAEAGVIPVLLPATTFCLREREYANARAMIDEFDLPVALATDSNPGTCPTESLQLVMALAGLELRMSPEEILAAVTINAARAIGLQSEVGSLEPGKAGDAVIWRAYDLAQVAYRFGANQAALVVRAGEIVV